ncbi:FHA domain-containing protein [bacterium AH-315-K03]|nr:FHA domain-containing protein [bacterium AH-315-K03]
MDFLIREVTREQGQLVYLDTEVSAKQITLGSAADQLIQLRGGTLSRNHAIFKWKGNQLSIAGVNNKKIHVNDKVLRSSTLEVGDELEFEKHRILIVHPPAGFDAACELIIDEELQNQALESSYITQLSDTVLGKRTPSYLFSLLVLFIFFLWPFSSYLLRGMDGVESTNKSPIVKRVEQRLASLVPIGGGGDILWSSGPLLPAHQLEIGDDCSACHKKAFQKVSDSACLDCHQSTDDHFDNNAQIHSAFAGDQCQACHKEHNEPEVMVVSKDVLCVECHQRAIVSSRQDIPDIDAVNGFDVAQHPEFKLNYLLPKYNKKGTGFGVEWFNQLTEFASTQKEVSNLKFPHDVHLDGEKVQTLDRGETMVCNNCHILKSDQEHFENITMERHCSQCHDLVFDVADPERQLPHGNSRSVVQSIEEHFVRVYTDPNFKVSEKNKRRRRPGRVASADICDDSPFNCAMQRATREAGIQFTQRGCINCHEVSDNGSDDMYSRWTVLPVRINSDWYARAQFDHLSHLTQRGESETEMCSSCHEAQASTASSDVMIPEMNNCLDCHGDQSVEEKVSMNCISCHAFHPDSQTISPLLSNLEKEFNQ